MEDVKPSIMLDHDRSTWLQLTIHHRDVPTDTL